MVVRLRNFLTSRSSWLRDRASTVDWVEDVAETDPGLSPRWELTGFARSLAHRSPATTKAYESDIRAFVEWAQRGGHEGPAAIDRLLLRRYLAYLGTRRFARSSIARKAAALRNYFAWLHKRGLIASDPSRRLSAPSARGRLPGVLSANELTDLLDRPRAVTDRGCGRTQKPSTPGHRPTR